MDAQREASISSVVVVLASVSFAMAGNTKPGMGGVMLMTQDKVGSCLRYFVSEFRDTATAAIYGKAK